MELIKIATIQTEFTDKFGIPRQSGLVSSLRAKIVFEPEFRTMDAIRGLEEFSHIWLLWEFSEAKREGYSLTVTPPRLGGRVKKGVFATRAPYRPNSIGLSSVKVEKIYWDENQGPIIEVSGADMLDGTPIFDIKPYLPYTDAHPEAEGSFGEAHKADQIVVEYETAVLEKLPVELQERVIAVLKQDPRAAYNKKPDYVYGMQFAGYDIRFVAVDHKLVIKEIVELSDEDYKKVK